MAIETVWPSEPVPQVFGKQCRGVTFTRIYKDGNDWKDSDSFGRDDLLLLMKVADMAHSWIFENSKDAPSNGDEPHD